MSQRNQRAQRKSNSVPALTKQQFGPLTKNQELAFANWKKNKNLMLLGSAGSGKTFLALNFACDALESNQYKKIVIIRSIVATRDPGFLPGSLKEKSRVYEQPYYPILSQLYERGDAYDLLKNKGAIEFTISSFLRGTTFDDCIVIVDESQNMSFHELNTIITRIGVNTKIIFCGDTRQDDLTSERFKETSGLRQFSKIINRLNDFASVTFTTDDIVRSDLVKRYIIAKEAVEMEHSD